MSIRERHAKVEKDGMWTAGSYYEVAKMQHADITMLLGIVDKLKYWVEQVVPRSPDFQQLKDELLQQFSEVLP